MYFLDGVDITSRTVEAIKNTPGKGASLSLYSKMILHKEVCMAALHPVPGYVLVELEGTYKNVTAATKVYEAAREGILREVSGDYKEYIGSYVFWTEGRAGAPILRGGKRYVFVQTDLIEGYER